MNMKSRESTASEKNLDARFGGKWDELINYNPKRSAVIDNTDGTVGDEENNVLIIEKNVDAVSEELFDLISTIDW